MTKHQPLYTYLGKNEIKYEPDTGYFFWVKCDRKPFMNGKRADHITTNGYQYIKAAQKQNSASRLAYKLFYNIDPGDLEIDHINRNKDDNRIENLRLVTRNENLRNREFRPNECNATGVSLHRHSGNYRARYKNKTTYHKTIEEASMSYKRLGGYAGLPKKFKHGKV